MNGKLYERSADMRLLDRQREALGFPARVARTKKYVDFDPLTDALDEDEQEYVQHGAILVGTLDAQPRRSLIAGAVVTVVLQVVNEGNEPARGVIISLPMPADCSFRPGSLNLDRAAADDTRAADLFGPGLELGDVTSEARRTIVLKLGVEAALADILLSAHIRSTGGAILGPRAIRLTRRSPVAGDAPLERPFYEFDASDEAAEPVATVDIIQPPEAPPPVPAPPLMPVPPSGPRSALPDPAPAPPADTNPALPADAQPRAPAEPDPLPAVRGPATFVHAFQNVARPPLTGEPSVGTPPLPSDAKLEAIKAAIKEAARAHLKAQRASLTPPAADIDATPPLAATPTLAAIPELAATPKLAAVSESTAPAPELAVAVEPTAEVTQTTTHTPRKPELSDNVKRIVAAATERVNARAAQARADAQAAQQGPVPPAASKENAAVKLPENPPVPQSSGLGNDHPVVDAPIQTSHVDAEETQRYAQPLALPTVSFDSQPATIVTEPPATVPEPKHLADGEPMVIQPPAPQPEKRRPGRPRKVPKPGQPGADTKNTVSGEFLLSKRERPALPPLFPSTISGLSSNYPVGEAERERSKRLVSVPNLHAVPVLPEPPSPPDVPAPSAITVTPKPLVTPPAAMVPAPAPPSPTQKKVAPTKIGGIRSSRTVVEIPGRGGPVLTVSLDRDRIAALQGLFGGPSLGMVAHYLLLNALAAKDFLASDLADDRLATFVAAQDELLTTALVSIRSGRNVEPNTIEVVLPTFPEQFPAHADSCRIAEPPRGQVTLVRAFPVTDIAFLRRMLSNEKAATFLRAAQLLAGLCANDCVCVEPTKRQTLCGALAGYAALATAEISRIFLRSKMNAGPMAFKTTDPILDDAANTLLTGLEAAAR